MYSAIVLSGGKGLRMKREIPKQYLLLAGKPIIMHSLERIDKLNDVDEIILVCETSYQDSIRIMCEQYGISKKVIFVNAGETRQESVFNGLLKASGGSVIIHEAARPFAVTDDYECLISCENENAILGTDIPFTVLIGGDFIKGELNRAELINVQLPQKFNRKLLLCAHEQARSEGMIFTEDASLLYHYYHTQISVIKGRDFNIKITNPSDLIIGEEIYNEYIVRRR